MRLIDADAVYELHSNYPAFARSYADLTDLRDILDDAPTIEAEPVKHGRWVDRFNGKYANQLYECSECKGLALYMIEPDSGVWIQALSNACPHCRAKMDGGADHED